MSLYSLSTRDRSSLNRSIEKLGQHPPIIANAGSPISPSSESQVPSVSLARMRAHERINFILTAPLTPHINTLVTEASAIQIAVCRRDGDGIGLYASR
jgi:hypothetical protein